MPIPIPLRYPNKLPISPVHRLSPANYTTFEECRLKGILSANKIPLQLPKYPRAYLGTIIHTLISKSILGQISDFDDFQIAWDEQVSLIENGLYRSDLTCNFVPLSRNISDMADKKFLCWEMIKTNIKHSKTDRVIVDHNRHARNQSESWVQTTDGLIGGFIDLITKERTGSNIVEFKTGTILSDGSSELNVDNNVVKPEYLTQVYLYAGLFRETKGFWPLSIHIVAIDGKKYYIDYNENDCTSLVSKAKKDLSSTNCMIRTLFRNYDKLSDKLATPDLSSCARCNYRPGCKRYWSEKTSKEEAQPFDYHGIIREVSKLGDGTQLVRLENADLGRTIMVRKIDSRYDLSTAMGQDIKIYNLLSDKGSNNFKAGVLTAIYLA